MLRSSSCSSVKAKFTAASPLARHGVRTRLRTCQRTRCLLDRAVKNQWPAARAALRGRARPRSTRSSSGPYDNNVFVLRCKQTGDAVLLDAANEHEQLLELCRRSGRAHGARDPRPLGPHPGRARRCATPATRSASPPRTPAMLPSYDYAARGRVGHRGRAPAPAHDPHPRPHAGLDVLPPGGLAGAVQRRHALPGRPGQHRRSRAATSTRSSASIDDALFTLAADTIVLPGHGDDTTIGTERPHLQEWIDRGW